MSVCRDRLHRACDTFFVDHPALLRAATAAEAESVSRALWTTMYAEAIGPQLCASAAQLQAGDSYTHRAEVRHRIDAQVLQTLYDVRVTVAPRHSVHADADFFAFGATYFGADRDLETLLCEQDVRSTLDFGIAFELARRAPDSAITKSMTDAMLQLTIGVDTQRARSGVGYRPYLRLNPPADARQASDRLLQRAASIRYTMKQLSAEWRDAVRRHTTDEAAHDTRASMHWPHRDEPLRTLLRAADQLDCALGT